MNTKQIIIGIIVILALFLAIKVVYKLQHSHDERVDYKTTEQVETHNAKNENTMTTQEQTNSNVSAGVIEIATFELAEGVSPEQFSPIDTAVESQHVSLQPGFISRNTAVSENKWMVMVHWQDVASAQASMDSFSSASAAADFMANMNTETMTMVRYDINDSYDFGDTKTDGVVELATFSLAEGVLNEDFLPLNDRAEVEHVSQQPGFISRDTAVSEDGQWLALVHWEDEASAQASMASFSQAPAAADFVSSINLETMLAKTYQLND